MLCLKCDNCGRVSSKKGVFLREEYRIKVRVGRRRPTVVMYAIGSSLRRRHKRIDLCAKCLMAAVRKALA